MKMSPRIPSLTLRAALLLVAGVSEISGQQTGNELGLENCVGTDSFEKVNGMTLRASAANGRTQLFSSPGNIITAQCNNRCRRSSDCYAFAVDYKSQSCDSFTWGADEKPGPLTDVAPAEKINYFQRICLRVPGCEKAWIYERVPGYELAGYDTERVDQVESRFVCQELCLQRQELPCRSAEYYYDLEVCVLSTQTRRSQPAAYRASTENVDYLENLCAVPEASKSKTCDYLEYPNQDIAIPDLLIPNIPKTECQNRCDLLSVFTCRSFTYVNETSQCLLSSDDNISAGPTALESRSGGATYYQKAPCVDSFDQLPRQRKPRQTLENEVDSERVSLVCTATSMTVTLNTDEAFTGKLFAYASPRDCSSRGTGRTQTSLTFNYEESPDQCGTEREEEGVFTNTVVIQHHPIIQQKGDRAIKLYCYFDVAGDKVVTNSYDIISETVEPPRDGGDPTGRGTVPGIPTSIVNGTAPQPRVLLRIVDENGNDITGTKLGEPLYLRIELDGESIFDIFARNLIAQSGLDDEEIKLLDERGCPTDPVFPGLTKDETGALNGRFEAFKFSDTTVVNFQVNVQFCQGRCNPVDCGDGVLSYGKRRRRRDTEDEDDLLAERLVYDPNLRQEVLVFNTPLRKQIRVNTGTFIDEVQDQAVASSRGENSNGVFVVGDFNEDDVFCASWTVVIVTAISFVFLQFCILVVCVLCIYASRRGDPKDSNMMSPSAVGGSVPASQPMTPPPFGSSASSAYSLASPQPHSYGPSRPASSEVPYFATLPQRRLTADNALKSLRTSLRD